MGKESGDKVSDEKKTVCVDLDAVLAEYKGWKGPTEIGPPLVGAAEFLRALRERFKVVVHTTRANDEVGLGATIEWLQQHGLEFDEVVGKPIAVAYVDDRSVSCRPMDLLPEFRKKAYDTALKRVAFLAGPKKERGSGRPRSGTCPAAGGPSG